MIKDLFARVDWVRAINRGTTLARALRDDPDLGADHVREQMRSKELRQAVDKIGRDAVGCRSPGACACPLCQPEED